MTAASAGGGVTIADCDNRRCSRTRVPAAAHDGEAADGGAFGWGDARSAGDGSGGLDRSWGLGRGGRPLVHRTPVTGLDGVRGSEGREADKQPAELSPPAAFCFLPLLHRYRHSPAPRIASTRQLSRAGIARHRLRSAEVEVPFAPALHAPAVGPERVKAGGVDARLRLHQAALEVDARLVDS